MIVKFIAWRLAVAAAFAVCVALIDTAPAAAADKDTATRGAKITRTPPARVHTLLGAPLDATRPLRAESRAPERPSTKEPAAAVEPRVRPVADGVWLADGTFAAYSNY